MFFPVGVFGQQALHRPKVGLVLSGGGAKGMAHVGVLKVIEEAGVPVDYVAGTSMGSIIGGLYAIGYNAKTLEKIALSQDWVNLLGDITPRRNLSVEEKAEQEKYFISFPIHHYKVKLPSGLKSGQNISMLLSRLTMPVYNINDFSKLPRPFLCVATNIVTGQEVVLKKGYLPDAIRASMAIPTVFTPVEIDSMLLVDGGLVNNFPVDELKKAGADIIIGVNLGLKPYKQNELKNLAALLEQSIFFQAKEKNRKNQELCDIFIQPDVYSSNAASFNNTRTLIQIGDTAARKVFPELKKLAKFLAEYGDSTSVKKVQPGDSLHITEMKFEGLKNVSRKFLEGKLKISTPSTISIDYLDNSIDRAYGTQFFERVNYKLEPSDNGLCLVIRVIERSTDLFRIGARYDSQFKTQLLLNITLQNKLIKGTRLTLDAYLGQYPRFMAQYKFFTGWKPRKRIFSKKEIVGGWLPDIGISYNIQNFEVYDYQEARRTSSFNFTTNHFSLYASSNITNSMYIQTGVRTELNTFSTYISSNNNAFRKVFNQFLDLNFLYKIDSYDKQIFPHKGVHFTGIGEYLIDIGSNDYQYTDIKRWIVNAEFAFPVSKKLTVLPRFNTGATYGDSIPPEYLFYVGGSYKFISNPLGVFQFNGLNFMQENNLAAMVAGLDFQYELFNNQYVTLNGNIGATATYFKKLISTKNLLGGYGISYGVETPLGPVEIGVYRSTNYNNWQGFINIGYYF
jgi:NTE family protein